MLLLFILQKEQNRHTDTRTDTKMDGMTLVQTDT